MVCYGEYEMWDIMSKYNLEKFAIEHKVKIEKPIVDVRFDLGINSVREICAKIEDSDFVVFEFEGIIRIMEIGV